MKYKNSSKWFTLVELIVTITIIAILGTIAFISLQSYTKSARDAVRISDVWTIKSWFELWYVFLWQYPEPDDPVDVIHSWAIVFTQWEFWKQSVNRVKEITKAPVDPLYKNYYTYSISKNKNEYELWIALEDQTVGFTPSLLSMTYAADWMKTYITWKYNWVGIKTSNWATDYVVALPSLIANDLTSSDLQTLLQWRKLSFMWDECLPYSYNQISTCWTYINWNNILVFEWDFDTLSSSWWLRVNLWKNIQNAYLWSDIVNYQNIQALTSTTILTSNPSVEAQSVSDDTYVYALKWEIKDSWWFSSGWSTSSWYDTIFSWSSPYTTLWETNTCAWGPMIVDKAPWDEATMWVVPINTVYVLSAWTYTLSAQIVMSDCSAIIWVGTVLLQSSTWLPNWMISIQSKQNVIIDNLTIDWENYSWWTHTRNSHWIDTEATSSTISNIIAYNNSYYWINIDDSANVIVKNYTTFDNTRHWVYLNNWDWAILHNIKTYNNNLRWVSLDNWSDWNSFQNVVSYNNAEYWFSIANSNNNSINNSAAFNNWHYWVRINPWSNNFINNFIAYKNAGHEFVLNTAWNHINSVWAYWATSNQWIYSGWATDYYGDVRNQAAVANLAIWITYVPPFVTWTRTGLAEWSPLTDAYVIKPSTVWWDVDADWRQALALSWNETYSFWANIPSQVQPVKYNASTTSFEQYGVAWVDYNTWKKIGE